MPPSTELFVFRVCAFCEEFYLRNIQLNEDISRVSKYFQKNEYLTPLESVYVYRTWSYLLISAEDMMLVSVTEASVS
jgi:hypothetical protein